MLMTEQSPQTSCATSAGHSQQAAAAPARPLPSPSLARAWRDTPSASLAARLRRMASLAVHHARMQETVLLPLRLLSVRGELRLCSHCGGSTDRAGSGVHFMRTDLVQELQSVGLCKSMLAQVLLELMIPVCPDMHLQAKVISHAYAAVLPAITRVRH